MSGNQHVFGSSLSITDHLRKALVIAILNAIISISVAVLNTPNLTAYNFAILVIQAVINAALLVRRSGAVTNSNGLLVLFLIIQAGGTLAQNLPSSQPADPRVIAAALIQAATSALMLLEGEWSTSPPPPPAPPVTPPSPTQITSSSSMIAEAADSKNTESKQRRTQVVSRHRMARRLISFPSR